MAKTESALRFLIVCLGNSCRSPMFEALLRDRLAKAGKSHILVESAGTIKEAAGRQASEGSVVCMNRVGLDITGHRSRHVGDLDLTQYTHIVAMESGVVAALKRYVAGIPDIKVILANDPDGVPNPYQKDQAAYDECCKTITALVEKLAAEL